MPVDEIEEWTSVDPKDHEFVEIARSEVAHLLHGGMSIG
jgi:hypothetical protein